MNFNRDVYGVRKWQYEKLDDIDLLCEISIFLLVGLGQALAEYAENI